MDTPRILLIEDNPDDEALAIRALRRAAIGDRIEVARDGAEAIEVLFGEGGRADDPPDLVLLDVELPRIGGFEVLRRIRADERTRVLPVVLLSTSGEEGDIATGYELGANTYVRKSVDYGRFSDAVAALASYWFEFSSLPPREAGVATRPHGP